MTLTSDEAVRAMQVKYGRPGVSQQKRRTQPEDNHASSVVKVPHIFVVLPSLGRRTE